MDKLTALALDGSDDAVAELLEIERVILVDSIHDEDIVQEILIVILQGLPRFRGESAFATWAFRIALNRRADYYRKQYSDQKHVALCDVKPGELYDDHADDLIAQLPHKTWRTALTDHYVLGYTYKETGQRMGRSGNAARFLCRRGIEWLQGGVQ